MLMAPRLTKVQISRRYAVKRSEILLTKISFHMSLVSFRDQGVDYYNLCGITDAAKVREL